MVKKLEKSRKNVLYFLREVFVEQSKSETELAGILGYWDTEIEKTSFFL